METCENQRSIASGNGVKYAQAVIPFIPFGAVPALPFTRLLTTFIDAHFSQKSEKLPLGSGSPGHMASIIIDPGSYQRPYVMMEWVYGGVVQSSLVFKGKTEMYCERELEDETIYYKKSVKIEFLRELHGLHQKWLVHGDNARYLVDFAFLLAEAIREKNVTIAPEIPILANLHKIRDQIEFKSIDVREVAETYYKFLPNLIVECRGGDIPIHLGGKYTIAITEEALLMFLDGFRLHDNLADLTAYLIALMGRGLRTGQVKLVGWRWVSKIFVWWFKRRVFKLPKKMQVLAKIMANPFRLLVVANGKGVIVTLENGLPTSVKEADLGSGSNGTKDRAQELKDLWLSACKNHRFIHMAVTLKESPRSRYYTIRPLIDLSFLQQIDFYPHNDFVRFLLRKGPLQLICNVILPFLSA